MHLQLLGGDLEGVQRIAIARRVDAGVHHHQAGVVEVAADAGEQVGLVRGVHQHLHAFAHQGLARAHHGHGAAHVARQLARMPGDVGRLVAHEVAHIQRVPQRLVRLVGLGRQGQGHLGLALARLHQGGGIGRAPTQHAQRGVVQVFQQLALPGIPDLGAGAADVGHGQQVQRGQAALGAHALGKRADHVRVAGVLLLRHGAHLQVFAHQEFDQLGVLGGHVVLAGEAPHLDGADLGVVAASALADVVEQRCQVQQPGLVPAAGQLRAQRVLVHVLGHEEAPHVAQHHQRVLVHGVDVEQVVLHLAHDAAEGPQVAPQHRGGVHQPKGMGLAARLLQDLHEGVAVHRVLAEGVVHQVARAVEGTQRARRQVAQAGRLLVGQEGRQDGLRVLLVQVVAGHLDQPVLVEETVVDALELGVVRVQVLLDVQQQDLLQLHHRLGRPVVAAHQHLAGAHGHGLAHGRVALDAEGLGHGGLQIEDQPVLVPARQGVQLGADQAQRGLVALQLRGLELGGNPAGRQLAPVAAQPGRLRHPQDGVQVAQAAG